MYDKIGLYIRSAGYKVEAEFQFHPVRKWEADYAIPEIKVLIEIEGGTFGGVVKCNHCGQKVGRYLKNGKYVYVREGGRHNTGAGHGDDCEKYNAAEVRGWHVLKYTTRMVEDDPEGSECLNFWAPIPVANLVLACYAGIYWVYVNLKEGL